MRCVVQEQAGFTLPPCVLTEPNVQNQVVLHTGSPASAVCCSSSTRVPGDGYVLDDSAVTAYQLSDPKPFLSQLLYRPYSNRVLLAPHLLGPTTSGAVLDTPDMLVSKMNSSWGMLATEGFCNGTDCFRLPVVAGALAATLCAAAWRPSQ